MSASNDHAIVVSPRARRHRRGKPLTPLRTLDGIVLGLLDNSKPNAPLLLDFVEQGIRSRIEIGRTVRASKPTPSSPAPETVYRDLERECGAVLFASAD